MLTKEKLAELAASVPSLPVLVAEENFVMDGERNVAFVIEKGEAGLELAKFFARADGLAHILLFEVETLQKRIKELESSNLEWRDIVDNERKMRADATSALDYWHERANALMAHANAIKPPVKDGSPPSHILGTAPLPSALSSDAIPQPYPTCVHNPGAFPQPVATELKASGPKEYSVIYAESVDALTAGVRHQIAEGWQPAGGICAENFDAVFKPQPATRFYQAITR